MNKIILMGRLTKDPEVKFVGETKMGRYTLAVDKRGKNGEADFVSIVTFNKSADFAEKYLHKGMKIIISGRITTGSYTNKDGVKVYTTDVIADDQEFCEKKDNARDEAMVESQGFMNIPEGIDEDLPFSQ